MASPKTRSWPGVPRVTENRAQSTDTHTTEHNQTATAAAGVPVGFYHRLLLSELRTLWWARPEGVGDWPKWCAMPYVGYHHICSQRGTRRETVRGPEISFGHDACENSELSMYRPQASTGGRRKGNRQSGKLIVDHHVYWSAERERELQCGRSGPPLTCSKGQSLNQPTRIKEVYQRVSSQMHGRYDGGLRRNIHLHRQI